jgi:vacuolar protein-sorting-associated protein 4
MEELAQATEGFSGSDIKSLIKDAVYEPIRKLQKATFFKKINTGKWKPCQ